MSRKKKKNDNKRHIWFLLGFLALAVVILSGVLVLFGAVISGDFLSENNDYFVGDDAIGAIEQTLGAVLPASSENFHFEYTSWQDYYMRIRIDMPPSAVADFMNQITVECLQQPLQDNIKSVHTGVVDADWWQPSLATVYSGIAQCTTTDNAYWSMMIDQSNPDMWILYFVSFST